MNLQSLLYFTLRLQRLFSSQVALYPVGNIHYQQNLGCQELEFIAFFNSEDPGSFATVAESFKLPVDAVAVNKAYN